MTLSGAPRRDGSKLEEESSSADSETVKEEGSSSSPRPSSPREKEEHFYLFSVSYFVREIE